MALSACDQPPTDGDARDQTEREEFTLDLEDGGRIEAWVEDAAVLAEIIGPDGDVVVEARCDLATGDVAVEEEGTVRRAIMTPPSTDAAAAFATWLQARHEIADHAGADGFAADVAPLAATTIRTGWLDSPAAAVNYFDFTCPAGTVSARARVEDEGDVFPDLNVFGIFNYTAVTLSLQKIGGAAVSTSDQELALGSPGASPWIVRAQGAGTYRARVGKSGGGAQWVGWYEDYAIQFKCVNGANVESAGSAVTPWIPGSRAFGFIYANKASTYRFTCPAGTARAQARLTNLNGATSRLTLGKVGAATVSITDAAGGAPAAWLNTPVQGAGTYRAALSPTAGSNSYYQIDVRCLNAANVATTPTSLNGVTLE